MNTGGFVFYVLLFLFCGGIILWIFSFISFRKKKIIRAIISAILGLILFIPPVYTLVRMYTFLSKNNSLSEYDYVKEFTEINKGFSEIYNGTR